MVKICKEENPQIEIERVEFISMTKFNILKAINNMKKLNKNLSDSVEARQELDLRIGACFTRFQTLVLKNEISSLNSEIIRFIYIILKKLLIFSFIILTNNKLILNSFNFSLLIYEINNF